MKQIKHELGLYHAIKGRFFITIKQDHATATVRQIFWCAFEVGYNSWGNYVQFYKILMTWFIKYTQNNDKGAKM